MPPRPPRPPRPLGGGPPGPPPGPERPGGPPVPGRPRPPGPAGAPRPRAPGPAAPPPPNCPDAWRGIIAGLGRGMPGTPGRPPAAGGERRPGAEVRPGGPDQCSEPSAARVSDPCPGNSRTGCCPDAVRRGDGCPERRRRAGHRSNRGAAEAWSALDRCRERRPRCGPVARRRCGRPAARPGWAPGEPTAGDPAYGPLAVGCGWPAQKAQAASRGRGGCRWRRGLDHRCGWGFHPWAGGRRLHRSGGRRRRGGWPRFGGRRRRRWRGGGWGRGDRRGRSRGGWGLRGLLGRRRFGRQLFLESSLDRRFHC